MKTTNLIERAFDNLLDLYERLGNEMPPFCEYIRLFTELPISEGCLIYVYQDVLMFHRLAYKLFSLRSTCEIELLVAILVSNTDPLSSVAETVQAHLESIEPYVRVPRGFAKKTWALHTSIWIIRPKPSSDPGPR